VAEEIWNDPEYLSEFLVYGTEHILNFYFGDIPFDHEVAKKELEKLLFKTENEMIRKGREERNPLYLLSGNFLKKISDNFKGFKNIRKEDKYREILRDKYRKALSSRLS